MSTAVTRDLRLLEQRWREAPTSRLFAWLADAYRRRGELEKAIAVLQEGSLHHPEYVSALVLLGLCYRDLGRTDEADVVFARVLALEPDNLVAMRHQAERAVAQGAMAEARAKLEEILALDPFDRVAQERLQRLQAATLEVGGDVPRAAPVSDAPAIDLGKVQGTPPVPSREAVGPQPPPAARLPVGEAGASRPGPAVRGPMRTVEERVLGQAGASQQDELTTRTLAQIYESQGYLEKALAIYDGLQRRNPGDAEIGRRLEALRRRLAGADDSATLQDAAGSGGAAAPPGPEWRPVEVQEVTAAQASARRLRDAAAMAASRQPPAPEAAPRAPAPAPDASDATQRAGRLAPPSPGPPAAPPAPAPPAAVAPEEAARATPGPAGAAGGERSAVQMDEDFERFLRYVRSLKR